MTNLLLVGGSQAWSAGMCDVLRSRGLQPPATSRWVETSVDCRAALAEIEWDVALCFAEGDSLSPAVAPLLEIAERPPLVVVVTEAPSSVLAAEALRHGAGICSMPADVGPLAEFIARAARVAGLRRHRRRALFEEGQRNVLERIARGAPLPEVLDLIVSLVEGREDDLICSLLLLDEQTQTIRYGSAPRLPEAYNRAIDGQRIGPTAGSCGAAAFLGEAVVAEDIATHPNWEAYRDLALPHGLRACWSTPVFSPEGRVLGTFAIYHRAPHRPTDEEREWVAMATRLASIAILRDHDLHAIRRSEEAIRAEERVRRMIYEAVSDVIFYIAVEPGERYRFELVNPAFLRATGLSEVQVVGKLIDDVIPPASLAVVRARYSQAIRERQTVRWEEISEYPSGTKHGDVAITPIFDASGACTNLVGTVHDFTARKDAEAKIAKQAALLDRAKDAIIVHGTDDVVRFWNAGAMRLYGWTSEEAVGRSILALLYRDARAYAEARRIMAAQGEWSGEIKQWTKSGRELVVETSWTLMRDAVGHPEAVLAINTDVTERKRLQAEVALAQRMDSLGALAGGIAHDFNNLLSAIIGHLGLAARELPPEHPTRRRLETVRGAANRATDLVKQILTFSRRHEPRRAPTTLQPIVEEALKLLRSTLPAMIEIRTRFAPEACNVLADASQIHQVVMNLGTNAAHAMGSHGLLEVRLAPVTLTARLPGIAGEAPAGRYMRLTVTDSGCGMDQATILRIFDPFFTSKNAGGGTGLGLFVVLGIVKDHGGVINVTSRPREGSTFEIHLPEAASAARAAAQAPSLGILRGHGERVFIVDDEASVVAFLSETLAGLGYEVRSFTDPAAALNAFKADPAHVDALVSDYGMPGMTGIELAHAFHKVRAPLPIFMASGYLHPDEAEEARRAGVHVLQKPDFIEELARALVERFAPA